MLVGNLLSSFSMTYATMPFYVNPLLKNWLQSPSNALRDKTNLRGVAMVIASFAFWVVVFYVLTTHIMHLN
jgi:hypothetical protein